MSDLFEHPEDALEAYQTDKCIEALEAEVQRLREENEKYSAGMQENCQLRGQVERLQALVAGLEHAEVTLCGMLNRQVDKTKGERARVRDYEERLTAVMPPDFKDWHEGSRQEWPEVAARVIRSLRERGEWALTRAAELEWQHAWTNDGRDERYFSKAMRWQKRMTEAETRVRELKAALLEARAQRDTAELKVRRSSPLRLA